MTSDAEWRNLIRTVFERSANAMSLIDDERRLVSVNDAKVKALGRPRDELVGLLIEDIVVDEQKDVIRADWLRAVEDGTGWAGVYDFVRPGREPLTMSVAASRVELDGHPVWLCADLHADDDEEAGAAVHKAGSGPLTPREREIVSLLALGRNGPDIADELGLAQDTVRTHVRNAMAKTGAQTRAHLVSLSLAGGLIDVEP